MRPNNRNRLDHRELVGNYHVKFIIGTTSVTCHRAEEEYMITAVRNAYAQIARGQRPWNDLNLSQYLQTLPPMPVARGRG